MLKVSAGAVLVIKAQNDLNKNAQSGLGIGNARVCPTYISHCCLTDLITFSWT